MYWTELYFKYSFIVGFGLMFLTILYILIEALIDRIRNRKKKKMQIIK